MLLSLVVILMGAKLGGDVFERLRQPAVLGELLFGVILGNLSILGFHGMDYLKTNEVISTLAEIGVIFLLFEVGLESNIKEMMEVGMSSFLVATVGVICPMILGWWISSLFLPESGTLVHVFIGATLCATSVGITARVLKDLGRSNEKEARIILGAAVIDDVMGLVVLAAVSGIIKAADRGTFGVSPSRNWNHHPQSNPIFCSFHLAGNEDRPTTVSTSIVAQNSRHAPDYQYQFLLLSLLSRESDRSGSNRRSLCSRFDS